MCRALSFCSRRTAPRRPGRKSKERANNRRRHRVFRGAINRSVTVMVASRANRRRRSNSSSLYTAGGSSERCRDFREEPMSGQHLERRADTFQVGSPVDLRAVARQLKWQFCPGHLRLPNRWTPTASRKPRLQSRRYPNLCAKKSRLEMLPKIFLTFLRSLNHMP